MQRKELPFQRFRRLPIVRAKMEGNKDDVSVMHLYRCANCRVPMVYPLVSRGQDGALRQYYCSRRCQLQHWPLYVATQKPAFFELEEHDI
jgi:hypothetical protein